MMSAATALYLDCGGSYMKLYTGKKPHRTIHTQVHGKLMNQMKFCGLHQCQFPRVEIYYNGDHITLLGKAE